MVQIPSNLRCDVQITSMVKCHTGTNIHASDIGYWCRCECIRKNICIIITCTGSVDSRALLRILEQTTNPAL